MTSLFSISGRPVGKGHPAYIIAEMSANHGQDKSRALEIIHAMKEAGADAVKFQTYTPDTITLKCDNRYFTDCLKGTLWQGKTLYDLYGEAYTPWEWQGELKDEAERLGMHCFSTAFDASSVDFLESIHVPAYKIASFELTHLPLIKKVAACGKPMILSTGMATQEEIRDAVETVRSTGNEQIVLLKCTSAYPASLEDANLRTIPAMAEEFNVSVGLSDHTMGSTVPVTAVSVGACVIEKHFVLDRERDAGPDSSFSMEPEEFASMVQAVRAAERDPASASVEEKALGIVRYGPTDREKGSLLFRPSIFVVKNIAAGEALTHENIRIIRPGNGLPPKEFDRVLGKKAGRAIERGTPLSADLFA